MLLGSLCIGSGLIVKEVLVEFESLFGLKANPAKSSFYCTGVSKDDKAASLDMLHMLEGSLPVRYLGVPLITKKKTLYSGL